MSMFLPLQIMERASYICLGVFLDDTCWIKWSLIESTIILIVLISSCSCFFLDSYSLGYAMSSLMYFSSPFSFKMRPILFFKARKFSLPFNLSSSLVLGAILSSRSLNNEIYQNRRDTLPLYVIEWGDFVGPTGLWRSLQILLTRLQHYQTRVWISYILEPYLFATLFAK